MQQLPTHVLIIWVDQWASSTLENIIIKNCNEMLTNIVLRASLTTFVDFYCSYNYIKDNIILHFLKNTDQYFSTIHSTSVDNCACCKRKFKKLIISHWFLYITVYAYYSCTNLVLWIFVFPEIELFFLSVLGGMNIFMSLKYLS